MGKFILTSCCKSTKQCYSYLKFSFRSLFLFTQISLAKNHFHKRSARLSSEENKKKVPERKQHSLPLIREQPALLVWCTTRGTAHLSKNRTLGFKQQSRLKHKNQHYVFQCYCQLSKWYESQTQRSLLNHLFTILVGSPSLRNAVLLRPLNIILLNAGMECIIYISYYQLARTQETNYNGRFLVALYISIFIADQP